MCLIYLQYMEKVICQIFSLFCGVLKVLGIYHTARQKLLAKRNMMKA